MQLFYAPGLPTEKFLSKEESLHCVKVLRHKEGDIIDLIDGKGTFYKGKITDANHKKCKFHITESEVEKTYTYYRHIAIAPTKNMDRLEWFAEKAVEFGIDEISFFTSYHSERKHLKLERIEKKVLAATKQSIKAKLPLLNALASLEDILTKNKDYETKCIAYVDTGNKTVFKELIGKTNTIILIGPEGDFSEEEIQKALAYGYKKVSLGASRLRTETAGIAAAHLMNL